MTKLFIGGVPTTLDVENLMKNVPVESGTSVGYEQVASLLGLAVRSNRFRTVTTAWRKKLMRERSLQSTADGEAFHFLTATQALDVNIKAFHKAGRAVGRVHVRAGIINTAELAPERKEQHRLLVRESQAVLDMTRSAAKQIAAPGPVNSTVRIAKSA